MLDLQDIFLTRSLTTMLRSCWRFYAREVAIHDRLAALMNCKLMFMCCFSSHDLYVEILTPVCHELDYAGIHCACRWLEWSIATTCHTVYGSSKAQNRWFLMFFLNCALVVWAPCSLQAKHHGQMLGVVAGEAANVLAAHTRLDSSDREYGDRQLCVGQVKWCCWERSPSWRASGEELLWHVAGRAQAIYRHRCSSQPKPGLWGRTEARWVPYTRGTLQRARTQACNARYWPIDAVLSSSIWVFFVDHLERFCCPGLKQQMSTTAFSQRKGRRHSLFCTALLEKATHCNIWFSFHLVV